MRDLDTPKEGLDIQVAPICHWVDPDRTIKSTCLVFHWWQEPIEKGGIEHLSRLLYREGVEPLSVQFAVMADGDIIQCVPEPHTWCRHAKAEGNESCIGIEIQGQNAADLDGNELQFERVVALAKYLIEKYDIELDFRVTGLGTEEIRFHGLATHQMIDAFCLKMNGKVDVHLKYLIRILQALRA